MSTVRAANRTGRRRPAKRDGVVTLPNADPGPLVDPRLQQPRSVERLAGQPDQPFLLSRERQPDRRRAPGDDPVVIDAVTRDDEGVELSQRRHSRDRDQVPAAEPADLTLDATLLMRPDQPGAAEERVETVMAAQRSEPLRLGPVSALQHPHHRRLQIVVTGQGRDRPEVGERQHMPFQEGLLGLSAERDVERPPRTRQSQHEHPQLHHHPADDGLELPEIHLPFRARAMRLRHRHLHAVQTQFDPTPGDIA
jgi:hypothetical protein